MAAIEFARFAESFRVHYNLVKPHMALDGQTPGGRGREQPAGRVTVEGALKAAITREVTAAAEADRRPTSPD